MFFTFTSRSWVARASLRPLREVPRLTSGVLLRPQNLGDCGRLQPNRSQRPSLCTSGIKEHAPAVAVVGVRGADSAVLPPLSPLPLPPVQRRSPPGAASARTASIHGTASTRSAFFFYRRKTNGVISPGSSSVRGTLIILVAPPPAKGRGCVEAHHANKPRASR